MLCCVVIFFFVYQCLNVRKILAQNVKKLREIKGKRREEISLALSFDNFYISKLERCNINPTLDKPAKIAEYFEVKIDKLLKENQGRYLNSY